MKKSIASISTFAVVGFATASFNLKDAFHSFHKHAKAEHLERCVDTDCGAGFKCNEFKYCIHAEPQEGAYNTDDKHVFKLDKCGARNLDATCAKGFHCNEFGYCIPGEPVGLVKCGKKDPNGVCPSDTHCNEFGFCIPGKPITFNDDVDDKRCGPKHFNKECKDKTAHCNEFGFCIGGKSSPSNEMKKCGPKHDNLKCEDKATHCNEFGFCIPGAPVEEPVKTDYCGDKHSGAKCPKGKKCTEFGVCINDTLSTLVKCGKKDPNGVCPSDSHCNEFGFCIPGAPTHDVVVEPYI